MAHLLGFQGIQHFSIYSILVATVGAVICLVIYRAITGTGRRGRVGPGTTDTTGPAGV